MGKPRFEFLQAGETYLVYQAYGTKRYFSVLPVPGLPLDSGLALHCSKLKFAQDHRLIDFQVDLGSSGPSDRQTPIPPSCMHVFWSEDEIAELQGAYEAELEKRGLQGDANATMYEYAYQLNDLSKAWRWHCLAAHHGHAKARCAVGNYYRWGRGPTSPDRIQAYLWYTLAGDTEHAVQFKSQLATEMDADQVAEADRLVAVWQANPAECGVIAAQTEN